MSLSLYLLRREPVHKYTTSLEINRNHPPRDSRQLGRLACVHETMPKVDDLTVSGSNSRSHRTQAFMSTNHVLSIKFLTGLNIQPSSKERDIVYPFRNQAKFPKHTQYNQIHAQLPLNYTE